MKGKDNCTVAFAIVRLPVGEVEAIFADLKVAEKAWTVVDYPSRVIPFSQKDADKVRILWPFWHFGAKEAVDHWENDMLREEFLLTEEQGDQLWDAFVGLP